MKPGSEFVLEGPFEALLGPSGALLDRIWGHMKPPGGPQEAPGRPQGGIKISLKGLQTPISDSRPELGGCSSQLEPQQNLTWAQLLPQLPSEMDLNVCLQV